MKKKFWENKNILITGIYGFVGSNLCKSLISKNANIYGLYKFNKENSLLKIENINNFNSVQVLDKSNNKDLFIDLLIDKNIEICFHLASQVEVGKAMQDPYNTFNNNINLTLELLEATKEAKNVKSFVMSSTDKVYGDIDKELLPYKETYIPKPKFPYEVSKYISEILSACYYNNFEVPIVTTRTCNLFGPGQMNFSAIIPYTIKCLLRGEKFIARSDGSLLRDYLFIDDWIKSLEEIASKSFVDSKILGNLYNFGNNTPKSVKDITNLLCDIIDPKRKNEINESFSKIINKTEILYQSMNNYKASKDFNIEESNFYESIVKTIDWYKKIL